MQVRLSPCIVKEVREWEGSYYLTLDAPNETLKLAARRDTCHNFEATMRQLMDLNQSFERVDLEARVRAYVTKSGQSIDLEAVQIVPFAPNGNGTAAPAPAATAKK